MRKLNKKIKITLYTLFGIPFVFCLITFLIGLYLYYTADFLQPNVNVNLAKYNLSINSDSLRVCDNSFMRLNEHGVWETFISGEPIDRGARYGLISKDLLEYQEDVFVNQIHEIIPSEWWVNFLHKLTAIFNRNLAKHVPNEYREEIYAMSLSCSNKYNSYGTPYERQLNYHAAHDIGHAMQQYMLVGCSSFACWGNDSKTGGLIIGRNFDFYVGDDFAKNKVVLFVEPNQGYRFASISWPGMMGVLSGMNEKGLTVTINASKGAIPLSSAMPISLLARHILQYAANIDEAYKIAQQSTTFVSESILIGSAQDGYAAIIEKTPEKCTIYKSQSSRLICTNHYQSEIFKNDEHNKENIATSDSPYRFNRINELLNETTPLDPVGAVDILRNRYGLNNSDIGIGNEKAINQFIAHHAIVFEPKELRFWVSTPPWQLGEFVCYDLDDVFKNPSYERLSLAQTDLNISADSVALDNEYKRICLFRNQYKQIIKTIEEEGRISHRLKNDFIANNPNYFQVYNVLGDYELSIGNETDALKYWRKALSLEIPRLSDKEEIISKINEYD